MLPSPLCPFIDHPLPAASRYSATADMAFLYEYEELAEQFSPDTENGKLVLTAALAKRAVEDVRRVLKIREEKPPLEQMVREGIVGEDLFDKIVRDERELEAELQQVIEDSEMYREGWGKTIFQEASAIAQSQIQAT
ncbi:hypothetical protein BSLG_003827 [Batrachochytrium salamandrivorans]|nr:hypothetical protein BSLG_003827 [Batrachochytrium salamandrivorans]